MFDNVKSLYASLKQNIYYLILLGLFLGGIYLFVNFVIAKNTILGLILFTVATLTVALTGFIWTRFSKRYVSHLISFMNTNIVGRKLIAGGSFSYFEHADNPNKVSPFSPIARFLTLTVAFLGLAITLLKLGSLVFQEITLLEPTADPVSVLIWSILLFVIPIVLTPIIPVVWVMEDLGIKAWNARNGTTWRVADRFRIRFNSIIAVSAIVSGLSLTNDPLADFQMNLTNFITLILFGLTLLVYPLALYTCIYFAYFRGKVSKKVRRNTKLPIRMTELITNIQEYKKFKAEQMQLRTERMPQKKRKISIPFMSRLKPPKNTDTDKTLTNQDATSTMTQTTFPAPVSEDTMEKDSGKVNDETAKKQNSKQSNIFVGVQEEITPENYHELEEKYFGNKTPVNSKSDNLKKDTMQNTRQSRMSSTNRTIRKNFKKLSNVLKRNKKE